MTLFGPVNIDGAGLELAPNQAFPTGAGTPMFSLIVDQNFVITGAFAGLPDNPSNPSEVCRRWAYLAVNYGTHTLSVTPVAAPIANVQVNDGDAQRSEVTSITVTYSTAVTFVGNPAAAFELKHLEDGEDVLNMRATVSTNALGNTVVRLTFLADNNFSAEIDPLSILHGGAASLADGQYQFKTGQAASGQLNLFRLFGGRDR